MPEASSQRPLWLVTGLSGAGLSTTLKAMEDFGYEVVDNLRLDLWPSLVAASAPRPLAIGSDARTVDFNSERLLEARAALGAKLLFLDATDEVLQRRFTETRRRHPLAADRAVLDGIRHERELLRTLKDSADLVLDTSDLTVHELRRQIQGHCHLDGGPGLQFSAMSFSFRHGVPREADLVFDMRFLQNPHWIAELRPQTGRDAAVADYVASDTRFAPFWQHLTGMFETLLPGYQAEGKRYLTIAFGCTGGRHRSVALAERFGAWLAEQGLPVSIYHRDLDRQRP